MKKKKILTATASVLSALTLLNSQALAFEPEAEGADCGPLSVASFVPYMLPLPGQQMDFRVEALEEFLEALTVSSNCVPVPDALKQQHCPFSRFRDLSISLVFDGNTVPQCRVEYVCCHNEEEEEEHQPPLDLDRFAVVE